MPSQYKISPAASISIPVAPLTSDVFSPFGTVIENPKSAPTSATVNQGTAAKYPEISPFVSYAAPSGKQSFGRLNLFICNPRQLTDNGRTFTVSILERHPYTTQTFIPIGLDKSDPGRSYLVIVAPTLESSSDDSPQDATRSSNESKPAKSGGSFWRPPPFPLKLRNRINIFSSKTRPPPFPLPSPASNVTASDSAAKASAAEISGTVRRKGRGLPDLSNIKSFVCRGDQAVTYGVGTWHAPMVVLGDGPIEFVVVMHENGVGIEDCEECDIEGGHVKVDLMPSEGGEIKAKL